jgi:hypothetical protein
MVKSDRQSIGYKRSKVDFRYTNHTIPVEPGMSFYMATDGFTDQIGGEHCRKFGNARFGKLLEETSKMAFDYNYTMMMSAYEQNKMILTMFLSQSTDIPPESRVAIEEWLQTYRRGCEDFKKMTDEGYRLLEKGMSAATDQQ